MKPLFTYHDVRIPTGALALLVSALASLQLAKSETFIGAGFSDSERRLLDEGPPPTVEIFNVDTDTGARTEIQQFTTRGPSFLKAMDRDSSGTLWGVHTPDRLVTIDEETGIVTDVVTLTNPEAYIQGVPAIAFVPGAEEKLYAIVNFREFDIEVDSATKSDVVDGFLLAEINTETGEVTPAYPTPGGRYGNGLAHGLEYDPLYGLVHMWVPDDYDAKGSKTPSSVGVEVEILDPVNQTSEPVMYSGPDPYSASGTKTDSGIIPDGFQATTHSGRPGVIYVYQGGESIRFSENKEVSGPFLLSIEISEGGAGFTGPLTYTTCFEGEVFMELSPMTMYIDPFAKAMELTGDGEGILLDFEGTLSSFEPQTELPDFASSDKGVDEVSWYPVDSVVTSIGGYLPSFQSLATDPVTGLVYSLTSQFGELRPFKGKGPGGVGLNIIDRNGPAVQELDGFDIPLTDPAGEMTAHSKEMVFFSPLTNLDAIAFDDAGVLYGIASERFLVVIDIPSGEVFEVEGFDGDLIDNGRGHQLEYNPADGRLYILYFSYGDSLDFSGWTLVSVNRDGSAPVSTPVDGMFFNEGATSLVSAGPNSFVLTAPLSSGMLGLKDYEGDLQGFYGLSANGISSPPFPGVISDFFITALTQIPFVPTEAIPDVLIGEKRDRLDGDNVYNANAGPAQTISIRDTSKQLKGQFFAEVQNDGQTPAAFSISARGGKNSDDIKYLSSLGNITADVKRGLVTTLAAGAKIDIQVKFSRDDSRKLKEKFRIQAIAGGRVDAGAAKVKIKQPRNGSTIKPEDLL